MNIVLFGTAHFAIPAMEKILASDHRLMAVVTQPDRPAGRGRGMRSSPVKEFALEHSVYLFQPENCSAYEFMRELRALSPDVIVAAAYGQKLSNAILALPRFYSINIHPSLLPRYRGPEPVARAIMNGESHVGVTIMKLVEKMDAGAILGITKIPLPEEATTPEMEDELARVGADLLIDVLGQIQDRSVVEVEQDEREATYARKFSKGDGRIDWRKPSFRIANFVRALIPYPCAHTFMGRMRVNIYKVRRLQESRRQEHRPGAIVPGEKDELKVACGDGYVNVLELQPESRRRMSAAEFLNGYKPRPGTLLY